MRVDEFDYDLPKELIAQEPLPDRSGSRLMVVRRLTGSIEHHTFREIPAFLKAGDCLVLNDTRVIKGRLSARKASGGKVELTLLRDLGNGYWEALTKGRNAKVGDILNVNGIRVQISDKRDDGVAVLKFLDEVSLDQIELLGRVPTPPYIKVPVKDPERYQTVYAKQKGSAAAPTAGLHFTPELLDEVKLKGVSVCAVTLHIGLGTFRPVKVSEVESHVMHREFFSVKREACDLVNAAVQSGHRVIAVGTTVVRTLETVANDAGLICPKSGETQLFIYPGYQFKVVRGLVTNFHLPRSTLLMLVAAFAGKDLILEAYREAVRQRYRFYSFGDAMLIVD